MKIFSKNFKMNASVIIFAVLLCLFIFSLILFKRTEDEKLLSLLGSLVAGIIVAIIQFIIALQDYIQVEKLKELELIKVMYDRDDRTFYEKYINKAKLRVAVMGVTAIRFFNDFADCEPSATKNAKVLLRKLEQNVKVNILLPDFDFLNESKKSDYDKVKQHIKKIKEQLPKCQLEVKYFTHIPSHSIFIIDDTCIVGPVFPNIESKYTPALNLKNTSPLAIKYLTYFNDEWENAHE
jgi:hypothetical protein